MEDPSYFKQPWYLHPIPRSLNALALLASGGPDYLPLIRKEAEWAAKTSGMGSWNCAYVLLFLSEYKIAAFQSGAQVRGGLFGNGETAQK